MYISLYVYVIVQHKYINASTAQPILVGNRKCKKDKSELARESVQ